MTRLINKFCIVFILLLVQHQVCGQSGYLSGRITDAKTLQPIAFANISLDEGSQVVESDSLGNFSIAAKAGFHNIKISYLGYEGIVLHQVKVDPIKPNSIAVKLSVEASKMDEVAIEATSKYRSAETPLSIKSIGINEMVRLPGTTIDVSKIIKNLPGVQPKVSFGYNIIVRGGASHENKFFIDGIEIPSINHFSVQGVAGGPNGLINVDLLKRANLITGAFPSNRYNALSSVLELETRTARRDRLGGKFTLGATDVGLTLEGPLSKTSSFIVSARKSFSEYYLKAFKLPVLPAYTDYNMKFEKKWNNNELKVIHIGARDRSRLNLSDASEADASVGLLYNTGYIPEGDQNVRTTGLSFKRYTPNGFSTIVLSHSYFRNKALKYYNNSFDEADLWYDYEAQKNDTRVRFERKLYYALGSLEFGLSGERNNYELDNYSIESGPSIQPLVLDFVSGLNTFQYGGFISYSRRLFNERLSLSGGLRLDASSYGNLTKNPFSQLSPRLSASYAINQKASISLSSGSYYQLPPSVILAFLDDSELVNRNRIDYIRSNQVALGYSYQVTQDLSFSAETFYKHYSDYPFLLRDSISFANANADYVAVGNQPAESTASGQAYGLELFLQKKFSQGNLWSLAYNYSQSEFTDKDGVLVSSSWDTRHFLTMSYAKTFGKNWQIGAKFTYASSAPYSPFDLETSSRVDYWQLNRRGRFDFDRLNTEKLKPFHQLDFRIDKNIYKKRYTANFYLDIQNIYSSAIEFIPYLVPELDENGAFLLDPNDPSKYKTTLVSSDSGRVLPTIGVIIEL